jgi:hypothetical protein
LSYDIRGTRVSTAGVVASPGGLLLHSSTHLQLVPDVACESTGQCLVVWTDYHDVGNIDVNGLRWTAAGVVDVGGFAIAATTEDERRPSIGWNGSNYLVAFDRDGTGFLAGLDIYAARVMVDGSIPVANGVSVVSIGGDQTGARVAYGGGTWMLAWTDERASSAVSDVYAGRVNSLGLAVDGDGFPVSTEILSQRDPALAFDGSHFLIAWTDERNGREDVYAGRVTAGGVRVDGNGNAYALGTRDAAPALASDGAGHWLLAWQKFIHAPSFGATRTRAAVITNH